ncbi:MULTISPECIES: hypothetical protein [Cyanophyceae]|uniref:Uncharacterized protein n=1 Tax=Leptolyngbya subtilissima DQ-A4 TaxID=2933933 RepID=A0ABV0K1X9_9CYAN|nr:hypothetical protein [Nodosilinea sp. FACHB-141]MBD2111277.1 hypothetical protein [Nodosilinea sp. FACHB-141]
MSAINRAADFNFCGILINVRTILFIFRIGFSVSLVMSLASCKGEQAIDPPTNINSTQSSDANPQASNEESAISTGMKVQDLSDGDYFFSTEQPPFDDFSNLLLLQKQGNTIIGWASEDGSGNCFKQVVRSSLEVETTLDDPMEGTQSTTVEDGSISSSKLFQFDTSQYSGFDRVLQPCMEVFAN